MKNKKGPDVALCLFNSPADETKTVQTRHVANPPLQRALSLRDTAMDMVEVRNQHNRPCLLAFIRLSHAHILYHRKWSGPRLDAQFAFAQCGKKSKRRILLK
jgi:hypothetical protein